MPFKRFVKATVFILIILSSIIISLGIWLASAPREISFVTAYGNKLIQQYLPTSEIDNIKLYIDNMHLEARLSGLKLAMGNYSFKADRIKFIINPISLLPFNSYKLITLEINSSEFISLLENSQPPLYLEPLEFIGINKQLVKHNKLLNKIAVNIEDFTFSLPADVSRHLISPDLICKRLMIRPFIYKNGVVLQVNAECTLDNHPISASLTLKPGAQLEIIGGISNLSTELLKTAFTDTLHLNTDIEFHAIINSHHKLEKMTVYPIKSQGYIGTDHLTGDDIQQLTFQLNCKDACQAINLNNFKFKTKNIELAGYVKSSLGKFSGNFLLERVDIRKILQYWPPDILPDVYTWLLEHIHTGKVDNALLQLQGDPLKVDDVESLDYSLQIYTSNVSLSYLDNVPPVTQIDALLSIDKEGINIVVDNAKLLNNKIEHINAQILSSDDYERLQLQANVTGDLKDTLKLISLHTDSPIPITKAGGATATDLTLEVLFNEQVDDLNINAISHFTDSNFKYADYAISNGNLDVQYALGKVFITGNAILNGYLPFSIQATHSVESDNTKATVKAAADVDKFREAGFPIPEFVQNRVNIELHIPQTNYYNLQIDLTPAILRLEALGINKAPGEYAGVALQTINREEKTYIKLFQLNLPNFRSKGSGIIDKGELVSLSSPQSHLGVGSLSFKYQATDKNTLFIKSDHLDLANIELFSLPKIAQSFKSDTKNTRPLNISTDVKLLTLQGDVNVYEPAFSLEHDGTQLQEVHFTGHLEDGKDVILYYNLPVISLVSEDAGALLKGLGVYTNIKSGELLLKALFDEDNNVKGTLDITEFYVQNAHVLAQLLTIAALTSTSFAGLEDTLKGNGINFNTLHTAFRIVDNHLTIDTLTSQGPTLGIDGKGIVDLTGNKLNFAGIAVPVNIINSIIKHIPFIGSPISGGKNKGFIAVSFALKGYIGEDLKVMVNPLSIFAPGFLKELLNKFPDMDKNKADAPQSQP